MSDAKKRPYSIEYQRAMEHLANAQQPRLSGPQMAVLKALLKYINWDSGQCYPNKETLAQDACWDRRTVQRALRSLEDRGLIEAISYETGGRGRSTCYGFAYLGFASVKKGGRLTPYAVLKGVRASVKGVRETVKGVRETPQPIYKTDKETENDDAASGDGGATARRGVPRPMMKGESYAEAKARWQREDQKGTATP